jgi:archaetidylinositol phosphate synthase
MLKNSLGGLQKKIGDMFRFVPFTPNQITVFSVFLAALGSYYIYLKNPLGPLFCLLAFTIDGLDGALARAKNLVSEYGAYLDGISDRLVEFFSLLPLIFSLELILPSVLILFFGTCMTSFSKAYADHRGVMNRDKAAKMGTILPRTERVTLVIFALVLYVFDYYVQTTWILWLAAVLSVISFIGLQIEVYRLKA